MKIWSYLEKRREDLGVALFVVPALLLGLVVAWAACGVSLLLS